MRRSMPSTGIALKIGDILASQFGRKVALRCRSAKSSRQRTFCGVRGRPMQPFGY
jgi:hypothetical protein